MRRYIAYLRYVLRHKWFVLLAGIELGVPLWMLILHDWDKFKPKNFISYATCFNTPDGKKQYVETPEFVRGWKSHQAINKHHYQYWVFFNPADLKFHPEDCQCHALRPGQDLWCKVWIRDTSIIVWDRGHAECLDCGKPFPRDLLHSVTIPLVYRKELLSDWMGAGRALGFPDTKAWYMKSRDNIHIDMGTRFWIEDELDITLRELQAYWAANNVQ